MQGTSRNWLRAAEGARIILLVGAALWMTQAYFAPRMIGTPDALWYHNNLADAVTQFRAGVFPVYVGQSDYAFNGSIYPFRAAPYFQYLAGLLDLITGRSLGFFALQHLTVVVSLVAGAAAAYGALVWIAPRCRWTATALAVLYVTCPGVAGLFYAQDLYMSGMAIPWVPLAFAALVKSFDDNRLMPRLVLAASLAALWWAHSPIAFWATCFSALGQIVRMVSRTREHQDVIRSVLVAAAFCLLAAYPILSVFLLRTRGESIVPYVMDRELLLKWVSGSFPSSLEPIDLNAPDLSHIQLGYSLWIVLLFSGAAWIIRPGMKTVAVLLAAVFISLVLVFPVPFLTRPLWLSFPETVVGMTLYWPMQRFYILVAAAAIVCAQRVLAECSFQGMAARAAMTGVLVLCVLWSAAEASKLIFKASLQADTVEDSRRWAMTENVAVQRHTYGLFTGRPAYYSHGVVDPRMEAHLLDAASGEIIASDYDLARNSTERKEFQGRIDANPGILDLEPQLTLRPGIRYLLTFDFAHEKTEGLLQMIGERFYREYRLPQSGESKSFGSGPGNESSITVWTSTPGAESVRLRFIPTGPGSRPMDWIPFAKFSLQPIDAKLLPIDVESLIPYTAMVRSPRDAVLESPRMFVPGYAAEVNGAPVMVSKSHEGLVEFPVPQGESRVILRFVGPLALRASFWLSAGAWILALGYWLASVRRKEA